VLRVVGIDSVFPRKAPVLLSFVPLEPETPGLEDIHFVTLGTIEVEWEFVVLKGGLREILAEGSVDEEDVVLWESGNP
jgi:hypothetical protein